MLIRVSVAPAIDEMEIQIAGIKYTDYKIIGRCAEFIAEGDTALREWLDATIFELTIGKGPKGMVLERL